MIMHYEQSLECVNPDIACEWHPTKNGSLTPKEIAANSNKKAWWLGKCGHEWDAVVATRNKGIGCPICRGLRVLVGYNDLATVLPELAAEWHPNRNGELTAQMVTAGSGKKVWWLGACGHEWQQTISNRKNGQGCPKCKGINISKKVSAIHIAKSGSLLESNPELAEEWHPTKNKNITPAELTAGSTTIVWWLGKCGHEWQASPSNRSRGTKCPICCNQKVLKGYNDLQTCFPDIAEEWHPTRNLKLKSNQVIAKSNKKVWWLGKCGHEWQQSISKRTASGRGCPECARKLQTSFPEQAFFFYLKQIFSDAITSYRDPFTNGMEVDIFLPSQNYAIEYDGINWHNSEKSAEKEIEKYLACKEVGIKLIRLREEQDGRTGLNCDYWIKVQRHPKYQKLNEEIISLLDYLLPGNALCVDTENDETSIRSQYITGSSTESFLSKYPQLKNEWDYEKNGSLNPEFFSVSSGVSVWWKCASCGKEWKARIADRTSGRRCSNCGVKIRAQVRNKNRINQEGSLSIHNPQIAAEWHPMLNAPLQPTDVLARSGKKVWWKCSKCNFEWETTVISRTNGSGCPRCRKDIQAKNRREYMLKKNGSLKENNPALVEEWNYEKNTVSPLDVTPNSHMIVWWTCQKCGTEWEAEIKARNNGNAKCPNCRN